MTKNPLNILVVDDKLQNLQAAQTQLWNHNVLAVSRWEAVREVLTGRSCGAFAEGESEQRLEWWSHIPGHLHHRPDVVLTDLMMPAERNGLGSGAFEIFFEKGVEPKTQMPYGLFVALQAVHNQVPKIAIVSGENHHEHPMLWAADNIPKSLLGGQLKLFVHKDCPQTGYAQVANGKKTCVKDWAAVLYDLMAPQEDE